MCGDKDYIKYIARLMDIAELSYDYMYKYPASLGGGEKQMVAIARALATDPSHSPRRAYQLLDVSVQAKIINTLIKLQKEMSLSYLFITHDLSLMRNVADRGHNVSGTNSRNCADGKLFFKIRSTYTKMLLSSIPVVSEEEENYKPKQVPSEVRIPSPVNLPTGCSFHTRCPFATEKCRAEDPIMIKYDEKHMVRVPYGKTERRGLMKELRLKTKQDIEDFLAGCAFLRHKEAEGDVAIGRASLNSCLRPGA